MSENLKTFFKIWLYFIVTSLVLGLVIQVTIIVGNCNYLAGAVVFFIGLGGMVAAGVTIGLRQ
jgi:hypothetical protein